VHELAIADSVAQIAIEHARGRPVRRVEVRVGHLRQVVPDALAFAFELVSAGTVLEGAELEIEEVPAAGRCTRCGTEGPLAAFPLRCEACGGLDVAVTRGEELLVQAIEVDDDQAVTTIGGSSDER
jgi:hydrogenase nickel incorporation protein HypA/HybF